MWGGVAAPAEEVTGTHVSRVLVFNSVVLALPRALLATRAKDAPAPRETLARCPGALAQRPALRRAGWGGAVQRAPHGEEGREPPCLGSAAQSPAVPTEPCGNALHTHRGAGHSPHAGAGGTRSTA